MRTFQASDSNIQGVFAISMSFNDRAVIREVYVVGEVSDDGDYRPPIEQIRVLMVRPIPWPWLIFPKKSWKVLATGNAPSGPDIELLSAMGVSQPVALYAKGILEIRGNAETGPLTVRAVADTGLRTKCVTTFKDGLDSL